MGLSELSLEASLKMDGLGSLHVCGTNMDVSSPNHWPAMDPYEVG